MRLGDSCSEIFVIHILCTFDIVGFKVILGSFGAVVSKWPVSRKCLARERRLLKFGFIVYVRCSRKKFFSEKVGSGAIRTQAFSIKEKYLMLYSIQSQHLYYFRHQGCWGRQPFDPYCRSLLAIFSAVKWQKLVPSIGRVILTHHIVASSMVMSYMKQLPKFGTRGQQKNIYGIHLIL